MFAQIKQVGMTYVTQRVLWWIVLGLGGVALCQLPMMLRPNHSAKDAAPGMLFVVGMPILFLLPFLVGQIKTQFAHARARVTPSYLPAHVAVASGILLALLVIYPMITAAVVGVEPLGPLALTIAIGVPALWAAHLNRFGAMTVSLVVFYSLLTDWGVRWWLVDAAAHRGAHALIVAAGLAAVIAWQWRLCHLNEEMDDYQNVYMLHFARRAGTDAVEQRRIMAGQIVRAPLNRWVGDWWHGRLGGYYGGSKAGLARLLRYGFSPNPIEVQGCFMMALFIVLGIFFNRFSLLANSGGNFGALFFFVQFASMLPAGTAGEMMAQRRPRTAFEMLLPVTRGALIDGLFLAAVRNAVTMWLMMNGALAVVVATTGGEVSANTVLMFVLMSASTMLAALAISLRVSVWPTMMKRFVVEWLTWMLLIPPIIGWCLGRDKLGDWPFVALAVAMAGAGGWLFAAARRAWMRQEFS